MTDLKARITTFFLDYGRRMDDGVRTGEPDADALAAIARTAG